MDELDNFLFYRGQADGESTDENNLDEGVLNIAELDGFFAAIVSGPEMIVPSTWLPAIWGDVEPEWESPKEFERIFQLMTRHMNGVITTLVEASYEFEPIFWERESEDSKDIIVDEWCVGYMRGVGLLGQRWYLAGEEMENLLMPITLFADEAGWSILDTLTDEEVVDMQQAIPEAAQEIYNYWLPLRKNQGQGKAIVNEIPRVGRNDPCPCGSGKKFKKCCLH